MRQGITVIPPGSTKQYNLINWYLYLYGTLGDPTALGALEKFETASKTSPQRAAAERTVASLRAARKPVDDFKNLRQKVLDLQKDNRELRKELDEMKRKIEAGHSAPVGASTRPAAPPAPRSKPAPPSPKPKVLSPKTDA
jgi:hypothetical protein